MLKGSGRQKHWGIPTLHEQTIINMKITITLYSQSRSGLKNLQLLKVTGYDDDIVFNAHRPVSSNLHNYLFYTWFKCVRGAFHHGVLLFSHIACLRV